jgi:hypothetical protein
LDHPLLKIMDGLCTGGARTLKLFVPDLAFIDGDTMELFYTDPLTNRIKKMEGIVPTRTIYPTMLRLKRKYRKMLEEGLHRHLINKINPELVHEKYLDNILPLWLDNNEDKVLLQQNKSNFMRYILHKDDKMFIQSIEEHKLKEN